jgi:selenocysteine lyase/cysteine desulfurase
MDSERAFAELERGVKTALEHYSNVHRGTGYNSVVSTALYEKARGIVREHLGLDSRYVVVFLTPWRLRALEGQLPHGTGRHVVSSAELGLPLGLRAVAVRRSHLRRGVPFQPGGGTVRMVSPEFVDWAETPARLEAGTPDIIGAIALAKALTLPGFGKERTAADGKALAPGEMIRAGDSARYKGRRLLEHLRSTSIGRDALVPTSSGELPYINFDNAASTPTFQAVWDVVRQTWRQPESAWPGIVFRTQEACARFFGAPSSEYDLVFTSNTTEALNIVAEDMKRKLWSDPTTVVLNTAFEHNSNELPWRYVPGLNHVRLPVDCEGFVPAEKLVLLLREYNEERRHGDQRIRLVCVCGASNVMGTYNDLTTISRVVHHFGARLLVDAAQLAAHRPIRMLQDDIDFLAFSAHKMYAPFGSGGLFARKGVVSFEGKAIEGIRQSGEENVAGIAALGKAVELLDRLGMDVIAQEEERLTCHALEGLSKVPGVKVYGLSSECWEGLPRKGGVICFELKNVPHNLAAQELAERGAAGVRSGCFCVNMYIKGLLGIGRAKNAFAHFGLRLWPRVMERLLVGLVRVSFGLANDELQVDRFLQTIAQITRERSRRVDRLLASLHFGTPFLPRTPAGKRISESAERVVGQVFSDAAGRAGY